MSNEYTAIQADDLMTIEVSIKSVLKIDGNDDNDEYEDDRELLISNLGETKKGKCAVDNQPSRSFLLPKSHEYPCKDECKKLPNPPSQWPQYPVMIRPTPFSHTEVIGVRRASGNDYEHFRGCCNGCILPINNGKEIIEPLVIDFESKHFTGTLLLRIKDTPSSEKTYQSKCENFTANDYFANKKRKFQCIIKGKFKNDLPINQIRTGQLFDRASGTLPARWIVTSAIKFISILAPQLDASLDGDKPRFLSPLLATAQTVLVEDSNSSRCVTIEIEEPSSKKKESILSVLRADSSLDITIPDTSDSSVTNRMNARKKIFNSLVAKNTTSSLGPRFSKNKVYTFEFFHHLLDFSGDELTLEMGKVGGSIPLARALDGQPLKIMAVYQQNETNHECELDALWSFDIFHESLYPYAQQANDAEQISSTST